MSKKTTILLLSAGILLSLAGCQKGTLTNQSGQAIRFGAVTSAPTRTSYSGEGTADPDNADRLSWERIDWVADDQIMIASDKALSRDNVNYSAVYRVIAPSKKNADVSQASIVNDEGKGLVWGDDANEEYTFWGVYPAAVGDKNLEDGKATFSIAASQSAGSDGKPDMSQAVMLAMITGAKPNDKSVDLQFYPAYTAFEFVLKAANTEVNLTKVELVSSSKLVGTVTATLAEGTQNNSAGKPIGASAFSASTDAGTVLTFTFPANTKVTKDTELTFTVFALPVDVVGLKLKFYTSDTDYQSATLKSKTDGDKITFDACRKHKVYGLAIPDGQWHLYLEADVLDWIEDAKSIQYGNATSDGVVVSASALEHITGATSWSRTAATVASNSYVKAYYSVYSPTNGKWRITLKGANASHFTITTDPAGTTGTHADGDPYIQGNVNGRIIFTLTPNGAASGESVELWFTVVMGEGASEKEYLLHSEVTRSNSPLTVTVL